MISVKVEDHVIEEGLTIGQCRVFANNASPAGWLLCDGSAVSRVLYPSLNSLYSANGYPWGNGDGSTTFNVPDLRGRLGVGLGQGLPSFPNVSMGDTFGAENHAVTPDQMAKHSHAYTARETDVSRTPTFATTTPAPITLGGVNSGSTGGGQSHPNVGPSVVMKIMVYTGTT